MAKTLILAVDRDDDFGWKGNIESPVIGIQGATDAAIALGTADPEDSDVNALLAAMNIYKELSEEGKEVEIALICGDKRVGYKSDTRLVEELNEVLDKVQPKKAILVGDGAEDEFIYPIISSRVEVDSVRKVYVKQAPGIEGSLYIFKKMISDPQKRKRFLVPLGALLIAIAMIYIVIGLYGYAVTKDTGNITSLSSPAVVFLIGLIILMYGYNSVDRIVGYVDNWKEQVSKSSISLAFMLMAIVMAVVGIVMGIENVKNMWDSSGFIYILLIFASYVLWPFAFAIFLTDLGKLLDEYMINKRGTRGFMTRTITVFGVSFIIQGLIDFTRTTIGYGSVEKTLIFMELIIGVIFVLIAGIIRASYKRYYRTHFPEAADAQQ